MAKPIRHRNKWRIRWTGPDGNRRSEVYADFKAAVFRLREHQTEVDRILRGLQEPLQTHRNFGELCDYWIENRVPRKRSGKHDESIIRRHLRPAFGHLLVKHVDLEATDRFVVSRGHLDVKTLSNIVSLLIAMLRVAVNLGWLAKVPPLERPKVPEKDFRYLKTAEEVARFLRFAKEEAEAVFCLYATAIYTGLRAGELAALRWSDIDFDLRLIKVARSYHGPTKGAKIRFVPILDPLLPVLTTWHERHPGNLVFTNEAGHMYLPSSTVFQEVLHRVLTKAQFPLVERAGKLVNYIVFHDLRHTFASHWMMGGGDIWKLQKILGHKDAEMTQRYAHLARDAFATDYSRLGSRSPLACVEPNAETPSDPAPIASDSGEVAPAG